MARTLPGPITSRPATPSSTSPTALGTTPQTRFTTAWWARLKTPTKTPRQVNRLSFADNKVIKDLFTNVLNESKDLAAGLNQWESDWDSAFQNNGFATMLCPAWMTGPIKERAGAVTGWNIADVYPGGGSNWGGSFLTVPATGKHTAEAQKLAAWLTAPEQQIKAFKNAGTFPSQVKAQSDAALLDSTNEFFNNAPVGKIFSARAIALNDTKPIFRGKNYFAIHTAVQNGITRVNVNKSEDAETSWKGVLTEFSELGF
ncbi:extracellular solute-binding protein [Arthrobacter psychrolactophilus]